MHCPFCAQTNVEKRSNHKEGCPGRYTGQRYAKLVREWAHGFHDSTLGIGPCNTGMAYMLGHQTQIETGACQPPGMTLPDRRVGTMVRVRTGGRTINARVMGRVKYDGYPPSRASAHNH